MNIKFSIRGLYSARKEFILYCLFNIFGSLSAALRSHGFLFLISFILLKNEMAIVGIIILLNSYLIMPTGLLRNAFEPIYFSGNNLNGEQLFMSISSIGMVLYMFGFSMLTVFIEPIGYFFNVQLESSLAFRLFTILVVINLTNLVTQIFDLEVQNRGEVKSYLTILTVLKFALYALTYWLLRVSSIELIIICETIPSLLRVCWATKDLRRQWLNNAIVPIYLTLISILFVEGVVIRLLLVTIVGTLYMLKYRRILWLRLREYY